MKFRQKIWVLPATAAMVFIAGSTGSYLVGVSTSDALKVLRNEAYPFKECADRFVVASDAFRAAVQSAASEGDAAKIDEAKVAAKVARNELAKMTNLLTFAADAEGLTRALDAYEPAALTAALTIAGKREAGDSILRMTTTKSALDAAARQVRQRAADAVEAQQAAAEQGVARVLWVQLFTGLVTLAALGVASVLVVRSVWKDLGEEPDTLRRLTDQIAAGDLAVVATHDAGGNSLRGSLVRMASTLQGLVAGIRQGAASISGASSEIAAGNQDLSVRTERTAANLQNAASAMEEMTSNVRQTAHSAQQAGDLARHASESARRGGDVVDGVVANMSEIASASSKIGVITSVIDGIAFQTNILALNAAVEAARAGEQGRGFAVVATEVRTLAQRSAQAAREIKQLIAISAEKVEGGSRLVRDAGLAMEEIVAGVKHVTQIIDEITVAAKEQSDGIGNVNESVVRLDEMTQQNAALVEQSAAAAGSLLQQARALVRSVAVFRLNEAFNVGSAP